MTNFTEGFIRAGAVIDRGLNVLPMALAEGRTRHLYGDGPFARLIMPDLPAAPGVYLWELDGAVVYVGQTRTPLRQRVGPRGYSVISAYNTYARQPKRRNGGQQTNCRVNALANQALSDGSDLVIWYKVTDAAAAKRAESDWMREFGLPIWNRRMEAFHL